MIEFLKSLVIFEVIIFRYGNLIICNLVRLISENLFYLKSIDNKSLSFSISLKIEYI